MNYRGNDGTVKLGTDAIGELKSWSVEESTETHDTTTLGATWRSRKPMSINSWSGGAEAFFDEDDVAQTQMVIGAEITLNFYGEGETTGNNFSTGSAIITGISREASFDGMYNVSFTFEGNGELTKGAVPV